MPFLLAAHGLGQLEASGQSVESLTTFDYCRWAEQVSPPRNSDWAIGPLYRSTTSATYLRSGLAGREAVNRGSFLMPISEFTVLDQLQSLRPHERKVEGVELGGLSALGGEHLRPFFLVDKSAVGQELEQSRRSQGMCR